MSEKFGLNLNIQKIKIMASGPITSWEIDGETVETVSDFIFLGSKITADGDCSHEIKRYLLLGHVWMWELDCEESWVPKNCCSWIVVLEKILESPLDSKEIQPVHSKGDQPWVFFGRNDAKAETPVLWPPHAKSWLIGKDSDAGRDWGQGEKGTTGWDGWMASPTQWIWVWVNSGSWWWTGRPGVLWFMGLQRLGHDWATELNWTERDYIWNIVHAKKKSFLEIPFFD